MKTVTVEYLDVVLATEAQRRAIQAGAMTWREGRSVTYYTDEDLRDWIPSPGL